MKICLYSIHIRKNSLDAVEELKEYYNFSFVKPGKLAGMRLPDRNALSLLKKIGIAGILSLTEVPIPEEIRDTIEYCHLPVQDFSAPDIQTLDKAVQFINYVDGAVAVHCFAGIGRTGTILAAYMISEGRDAAGAIGYIRKLRPFSIETSAQENILFEYQVFLTEQEDAHD